MKYLICENNKPGGKYFKGRRCYEEMLVDENTKSVLCWRCTSMLAPPPEEKKSSGYPRGWKFMAQFVDKEGNVYHKGEIQEHLFGTLPPTEIKEQNEIKPKKEKSNSLEEKIMTEYKKMKSKKKLKKK